MSNQTEKHGTKGNLTHFDVSKISKDLFYYSRRIFINPYILYSNGAAANANPHTKTWEKVILDAF